MVKSVKIRFTTGSKSGTGDETRAEARLLLLSGRDGCEGRRAPREQGRRAEDRGGGVTGVRKS